MSTKTNVLYVAPDNAILWDDNDGNPHLLVIENDENPFDPREEDDGLIDHMMCWHRRYSLGDKHSFEYPYDCLMDLAEKLGLKFRSDDPSYTQVEKKLEPYIQMLPLWLYDHSGITMSCGLRVWPYNDQWDSGQVGFIYMLKDDVMTLPGVHKNNWRQKANEYMKASVKTYDQYITGDVIGFIAYEKDDNDEWVETDSCWGFFGSDLMENGLPDSVGFNLMERLENDTYQTVSKPDNL